MSQVFVFRVLHQYSAAMARLSLLHIIPSYLNPSEMIGVGFPLNGAANINTLSRISTFFWGSPSSCASTQYSVAGLSARQLIERGPVRTAPNPIGISSAKGKSATVCKTLPDKSQTSIRWGKR